VCEEEVDRCGVEYAGDGGDATMDVDIIAGKTRRVMAWISGASSTIITFQGTQSVSWGWAGFFSLSAKISSSSVAIYHLISHEFPGNIAP
jgi:hypothetical protein